jgi:hypothetical protein
MEVEWAHAISHSRSNLARRSRILSIDRDLATSNDISIENVSACLFKKDVPSLDGDLPTAGHTESIKCMVKDLLCIFTTNEASCYVFPDLQSSLRFSHALSLATHRGDLADSPANVFPFQRLPAHIHHKP